MQNPRIHGKPPYTVVAVHGGPGAQGSAYPLARELSKTVGVLEPMQTKSTINEQADELRDAVLHHAAPPVVLIGHSWGAWLAFITAAKYPETVRRLILVGSGPFEERWTAGMMDVRLGHLSAQEAGETRRLLSALEGSTDENKDAMLARIGALMGKADTYCSMPEGEPYETACDSAQNMSIWAEAAEMRRSGALLQLAGAIACPVTAIHGAYDPHPWQGVKEPLEAVIKDFRFILLERCGHEPWDEVYARDEFFKRLHVEVMG